MFLASHGVKRRETRVRREFARDPGIGLLLAAVNLEWTLSRAILFLGSTPNQALRKLMRSSRSLKGYAQLWKKEATECKPLNGIISDWAGVLKAFEWRNLLVHGVDRCTRNMAKPHINVLLEAVSDVDGYCASIGVDLTDRMPVRRTERAV